MVETILLFILPGILIIAGIEVLFSPKDRVLLGLGLLTTGMVLSIPTLCVAGVPGILYITFKS